MLRGIGASAGIGMGTVVCIREPELDYSMVKSQGTEPELLRLHEAADSFIGVTQRLAADVERRAGKLEADILLGQTMMLEDPAMRGQMEEMIASGCCAEAALDRVCQDYIDLFSGLDDELMRQRAADIRDLRTRMLRLLLGISDIDLGTLPKGSVLVAKELTPSMTVGLTKDRVSAIITEIGGTTSHAAILARTLEIPAVLGVSGALELLADGQTSIVDGSTGEIIVSPSEQTMQEYTAIKEEQRYAKKRLEIYRDRATKDADGRSYRLCANIGGVLEAQKALENGAEGVGLFRTEFLFMDRAAEPMEEEQYQVYRCVSDLMQDREVIIRTLDVGGDKEIPYLGLKQEPNPFLGWRAIRYCLQETQLFKIQLRALLRAGARNRNIKIMLPLVTGLQEMRAAKALLAECKKELQLQGFDYDQKIAVGVMVETPAAALLADLLAKEVDFFSIGTNDLTQYTLAVDRGNAKIETMYTHLHPAVLRSIRSVIKEAKRQGIPVGMCGEAAADPRLIPLLLYWGLDEFSVSPAMVLQTRKNISQWSQKQLEQVEQNVMKLDTAEAVEQYLSGIYN